MSDDCQIAESYDENSSPEALHISIWSYVSKIAIGVLRLRRAQLALTTILVSLLIMYFPNLESLRDDLLMLMTAILMVALGGYSMTDALYHGQADNERLEDLLEAVADELGVDVEGKSVV